MTEKKFSIPLIILSVISWLFGIFGMPIECIAASTVMLIINLKKKDKYFVKIPVAVCIFGIALSLAFLAFLILVSYNQGITASDYWFLELLYGKSPY